jgi:hypothetical protein
LHLATCATTVHTQHVSTGMTNQPPPTIEQERKAKRKKGHRVDADNEAADGLEIPVPSYVRT